MSRTPVLCVQVIGYRAAMSDPTSVEHRHLRSAIEYAVAMGDEIVRRKAPISVPRELGTASGKARIPTGMLGQLRRSIDSHDTFRAAIAAGALPELVDPIGMLWLQRPDGWETKIGRLAADKELDESDADLRTALRREEKRRRAAEQVAVRLRADVADRDVSIVALRADIDALRTDVVTADNEVIELRSQLVDARIEARHARDREAAAKDKLDAALDAPMVSNAAAPKDHTQDRLAGQHEVGQRGVDPADVSGVARAARDLADRLEALLPTERPEARARTEARQPVRLPGGVIASSSEAAEFLLRSEAVVLVDGYNVAKLAWSNRSLDAQRTQLLDALENVARRFACDITVVFDGASIIGAHATRRRLIRVVWSPEGVIADDVIRDEVRRLPAARAVVVVTNDAEIVADVKALGANVLPSNALIAVL
jgi:predicted RNA-binding protein with PIN domain